MAEIDYLSYAFAVLVLGGGIVGYLKVGESDAHGQSTCGVRGSGPAPSLTPPVP